MIALVDLLAGAFVLVVTVGLGTVVHELSHAAVLEAFGVPYDVTWLPGGEESGFIARSISSTWATVTPRRDSPRVSPRGLRVSAIAPLSLVAVPLVIHHALPAGLSGDVVVVAATVAWFGCALPSPQDFSLFWYAERVVDGDAGAAPSDA